MNNRGVTIIEIIIVVVTALLLVAVFASMVSRNQAKMQNVYKNEARIVIKDIVNKQRMYHARFGSYVNNIPETDVHSGLDIDLRKNEYFRTFESRVETSGAYNPINPRITVNVFGAGGALGMTVSGTYDRNNTEDDKIKFSL